MASEEDKINSRCAYMRRRRQLYKERDDEIKQKLIKRMTKNNPSQPKYTKPNKSIPTMSYQPPAPKQMISAYNQKYIAYFIIYHIIHIQQPDPKQNSIKYQALNMTK